MWQERLRKIAEGQHGAISGRDLDRLAVPPGMMDHEMRVGRWTSEARHVWSLSGSPDSPERRTMIAVLAAGPGSVISHHSAAALWALPGYELEPLHLTRIRGSNSTTPAGTVVHRVRRLRSDHVTELGPFPLVRPEIVLIQLAGVLHRGQTEILLDRMWNKRLLTGRTLDRAIRQMSARGRRGVAVVRELLAERGVDWTPPASGLEGRVRAVLERHGLSGFRLQVDLGDNEWIGRVDFAHENLPVVIEVQSEHFHAALSDRRRDCIRHAKLAGAGFQVIEVWESDVWYRPDRWINQVQQAMQKRAS